ncbi:YciI family protein [Candidatus Nitrosacidococcus tergens]|uniref:Putative enzyme n=1 Tax=Candidatus Nitrosacidococcus tergens TaxID=553981 RepID=A0A7G1Q832_9GAMM|nr:YciI family protein [Candidatus Nitrosacidococcus tergens]CAB1274728.1 putative enzyme [Candidatus Nitrosacidococcus tergens]
MLYAIVGQDREASLELRRKIRPAHLDRIQILKEEGRLVLAGPFPAIDTEDPGESGFTGSLIVAEFPSLAEAQTWANTDPFLIEGVYTQVMVKPFKYVLP